MSEKDKICRELGYPSGYAQALSMLENSDDLKCDLDDIIAFISSLQSENERLKEDNLRLTEEVEYRRKQTGMTGYHKLKDRSGTRYNRL
jgi:FtsZ-binding cell division protein ZapB